MEASRSDPNWLEGGEKESSRQFLVCCSLKAAGLNSREGGDLSELSEVELEGSSDGLHDLGLGSRSDSGDGKSDVNRRSDSLEEELGLQEDCRVEKEEE